MGAAKWFFTVTSLAIGTFIFSLSGATGSAYAQAIGGRISGTIRDASGGVMPGVTVTITDEGTQLTRTALTDDNGFYLVTNLPVGRYSVTAAFTGFRKAQKTGYELTADGRLTADFKLEVGEIATNVEVTVVAGETVNNTSGEIARVVDGEQVQNLALNGRNYIQLISLIPGAALLDENQMALTTSLSITAQSVNGNRGNTNHLSVDGGSNMDSGSNGSQINNVGIDFIKEVKIQTSNFSAEYGRNSGAAINVVTRGGEARYHGGVFEFFRNDALDARNFFAREKSELRFNNFGWNLSGPVKRGKLFFFAGEEFKAIRRDTDPARATLPTRAERAGDFSGRFNTNLVRDPLSGLPCSRTDMRGCFPNNVIPANRITTNGRAIAAVYNTMERLARTYIDTPTGNNAIYQMANPFDSREDIVRIDYRLNDRHNLYGRYLHDNFDLIDPFGTFSGSNLPTTPSNRRRPGTSIQLGYTWLINPKWVNEAKASASWNGQRIPPVGGTWQRDTYGFTFPQLFSGGLYNYGIPDIDVGGFSNFRGPAFALLSPTTDIALTDNLTVIRRQHTIKTGAQIIRNRKDQNGRPAYTGRISFNGQGNPNSSGNSFADVLLGNFRTYSEAEDDPIGFFRFSQYEAFITDSWKIHRRLSLELGVRYQYGLPTYTQANNIVNFDPRGYDPARAVTVTRSGTIVPGSGDPYNGLIRAGDGVPASELRRVPNGQSPEVLAVPAGAPRGLFTPAHLLAPRFSFAWAPFHNNKTAVRGGFGIFYDRPEGNIIYSSTNVPPFLRIVQFENGNLENPSSGTAAAAAPLDTIFTLDPKLKIPYTMNWSLSIQRELPRGIFLEVAYVANQGRRLLRQPDINQPPFNVLVANAALPTRDQASVNALRPYAGYSQIRMRLSDTNSNYNALQLYVTRRKGRLILTGSYTWSKVLTDASGNGDNLEEPFNRHFNYGPANFDRRHIFVSTYTYTLPFFRRAQGWRKALLYGWEGSGITRFQTGQYYTITGFTSIGERRADYLGGPVTLPNGERTVDRFFNRSAFMRAPDTRRGNSGVGIVTGPGLQLWDLSLRKQMSLTEKVQLRFQVDLFNLLNHANLRGLSTSTTARDFGAVTSAGPGRNIQFGMKLNF